MEDSFCPFRSTFKGVSYHSAYPPSIELRKNPSCRPFVDFVCKTLLNRIYSGAVSVLGHVGQISLPDLVLPLTVGLTKPEGFMASSQSSLPRNERQGKYTTSKLNPRSVEEQLWKTIALPLSSLWRSRYLTLPNFVQKTIISTHPFVFI